jgi:hypothetical protein
LFSSFQRSVFTLIQRARAGRIDRPNPSAAHDPLKAETCALGKQCIGVGKKASLKRIRLPLLRKRPRSWVKHPTVQAMLAAFPDAEMTVIRGPGRRLDFCNVQHKSLHPHGASG